MIWIGRARRFSRTGPKKNNPLAKDQVSMSATTPRFESSIHTTPLASDFGLLVTAGAGNSIADLDPAEVMDLLREHGVVLFRGFGANRPDFEDFTRHFASEFVLPMMRVARPKVDGAADAKTAHVDVGSHAMGLHQELSFTPVRPEAIWLWCQRTAGTGGETTVADGTRIYAGLSDAHKRLFETTRLKFTFGGTVEGVAELFRVEPADLPATLARHADALTYTQDGNALLFNYLTSALQRTKFGGATAFANFLLFSQTSAACGHPEARRVMGMMRFEEDQPIPPALVDELTAIAEPLTYSIKWQAGDLVMIDNTRMMHGRRGFEASSDRTVFYRAARKLRAV